MNDQEDEGFKGNSSDNSILANKVIVVLSCLLSLLRICEICFSRPKITKFVSRGINVLVTRLCTEGHSTEWRSQPKIKGDISAGTLLPMTTLFTGNTYTPVKEFMDTAKISQKTHLTSYRQGFYFLQKTRNIKEPMIASLTH